MARRGVVTRKLNKLAGSYYNRIHVKFMYFSLGLLTLYKQGIYMLKS